MDYLKCQRKRHAERNAVMGDPGIQRDHKEKGAIYAGHIRVQLHFIGLDMYFVKYCHYLII